jgi:KDO2-lipid IV(A) lauroyltransferase
VTQSFVDLREGGEWTASQRRKNDVLYAIARALIACALALPRSLLSAVGRGLGVLAFCVLPRERRLAAKRLAMGLGERRSSVLRAFMTLGELLADTVSLLDPREPAHRGLALDPASRRVFADALAEGRGVVFIAAHLGPWERMAALLVAEGFPVATVARESYDPRFTAIYDELRGGRGVRSIYRGRPAAALAIARELAGGRAVGFLVDLPGRVKSLDVPLFGEVQGIALGPIRIALARRAAVVVGTPVPVAKAGRKRRDVEVQITRVSAEGEDERGLAQKIARELTGRIEKWPAAWLGNFARTRN